MKPLSREYLLARGSCCGFGCLNCPYGEKEENMKQENNVSCPECGTDFYCACIDGSVASQGCWCWEHPTAKNIPDEYEGECLCENCLKSYIKGIPTKAKVDKLYNQCKKLT